MRVAATGSTLGGADRQRLFGRAEPEGKGEYAFVDSRSGKERAELVRGVGR